MIEGKIILIGNILESTSYKPCNMGLTALLLLAVLYSKNHFVIIIVLMSHVREGSNLAFVTVFLDRSE